MRRVISIIVLLTFFFSSTITPTLAAMTYLYDQNGNMSSDGTRCFEYNEANQLKKVKNCGNNQTIAEYVYDHNGKRLVKKEYENGALKRTVYSPSDEYETKKKPDGTTENTVFYKANDAFVGKKNPDGSLNYYHNDHLGSNSVLTNQSGTVVEKTTYEPYGEVKTGGTKSKFQYTGQEKDLETGLNYYDARYYDPHIQRFTQPDTLLPDVYDPQQLNRYSYTRNNPLKYVDPTGNFAFVAAVPWIAAAAVAALSSYFAVTPQGQQVTKTAVKTVASGVSQLASNIGKTVANTFNNKPAGSSTNQKPNNSPSQNSNTPQMQNPMQKIVPAIPGIAKAADKVHGNDLKTTLQTWGYKLVDTTTGVVKKIGETTNPAARYAQRFLHENNLRMDIEKTGSKLDMRIWEHEQIGDHIFRYGEAPALNNIERSVNVLR